MTGFAGLSWKWLGQRDDEGEWEAGRFALTSFVLRLGDGRIILDLRGGDCAGGQHWQPDDGCRSLPGLALQRDVAAVLPSDPARDRETQAGAARIASPRRVGAVEALEDMPQVVLRDAHAGVAHQDFSSRVMTPQTQRDATAGRCVLECVVDEDQHELLEPVLVARDLDRL